MGQTSNREGSEQPAPRRGLLARFGRDRRGSTAIEFTALAIPFAMLVFAILESCISFAGQELMTSSMDTAARQLRTGQFASSTVNATSLKQMICKNMEIIVAKDCPGLLVDLRVPASFADAGNYTFKISNGDIVLMKSTQVDPKQFVVEPGGPGNISLMRVFYKWPVITDFLAKSMANLNDGKTLQFATITWQNEQFQP